MGVVPIVWRNRFKSSIPINQPVFTVNILFAAGMTFASNQAMLRRLGSALKNFCEEHIATLTPIIAGLFLPVITAQSVIFVFSEPIAK